MNKWISVKDELPPKGLSVLVAQKIENSFGASFRNGRLNLEKIPDHTNIDVCYLGKSNRFFDSIDNEETHQNETHWRKLPLIREFTYIKNSKPKEYVKILILRKWKDYYYVKRGEKKLPDKKIDIVIGEADSNLCLTYSCDTNYPYIRLTHWMPLPEPPEN